MRIVELSKWRSTKTQWAWHNSYVGVGAAFAIGIISLFERRRRTIRIAADLDGSNSNNDGQNFVQLNDNSGIVIV